MKETLSLKKSRWGLLLVAALMVAISLPVSAEVNGPYSMGFNLNFPVGAGDSSNALKNGFGFGMDFGYRPETSPLGFRLDMNYANFALTTDALHKISEATHYADSGYATVWGFDGSLVLTPPNANKVRPYIQAGPGFYYEHAEASRYSGYGGGVVCDPWFGCYDTGYGQTVADWSSWRLGWMGGAGLNIEFDSGGAMFLQTQYHSITNTNNNLEFVPIAIGYRQSF